MAEIEKKRKFHDMWAFALYVLFTATATVFMGTNMKDMPPGISSLALPVIATNIAIVSVFVIGILIATRYFPEALIFTMNVVFPVLLFIASLFVHPGFIIGTAITLLISLWVYFVTIKPALPVIAAAMRATSRILSSNILGAVVVLVVSCTLQIIQTYILLRTIGNDRTQNQSIALFALFVFNNYWTLFNIIYFTQVLVSSIVINHALNEHPSFGQALSNSICALGSISFASMIMALISTAQLLIRREADNDRARGNSSLLKAVLLCLSACIVAILGDLVRLMNNLSFPYLALHGTGYIDSVKKSFALLEEKRGLTLANNLAVGSVVAFCTIVFAEMLIAGNGVLAYFTPSFQKDTTTIISMLVLAIPTLFLAIEFLSMFTSGSQALIYTYMEHPAAVEKFDANLAEKMRAYS